MQTDVVDRVGGAARELGGEPHVGALERAPAGERQRSERPAAAEQRHRDLALGELALAGARHARGHRRVGRRVRNRRLRDR
jgi:hypothetical protein